MKNNTVKNNNFLIFIPLLALGSAMYRNPNRERPIISNNIGNSINSFIKDFSSNLTLEDINGSINTLKKIAPYLSEPYANTVNTLAFNFEKVNKINELVKFLSQEQDPQYAIMTQDVSPKERFNKILITLKDDIPEEKIRKVRPIIDIITNFDNYKNMAKIISVMNTNADNSDKMEAMMDMIVPMLSQNEETSDKMKNMMKMFQALNSASNNNNDDDSSDNNDQSNTEDNENVDDVGDIEEDYNE